MKNEILFKNNLISVREALLPNRDIKYTYVQDERGVGDGVAILPFRIKKDGEGNDEAEFLVRRDWIPCWGVELDDTKQPYYLMSAISNFIKLGPSNAVVTKLKEITGYAVATDQLVELGATYVSKISSSITHLYSVDLTGLDGQKTTTEDPLEIMGEAFWTTEKELIEMGADPLLHVMFSKLLMRWT